MRIWLRIAGSISSLRELIRDEIMDSDKISTEAAAEILTGVYERQVKRLETIIYIQAAIIICMLIGIFLAIR